MTLESFEASMAEHAMNDYYELLRVAPDATKLDIINAYRRAKLTFRKDSLAVYSLYSEEELALVRLQVDKAYAVLSDREKRHTYDVQHGYVSSAGFEDRAWLDEDELRAEEEASEEASAAVQKMADNVVTLHPRKARDYDPDLERRMQSSDEFPGVLLREVREYRGISLQDIALQTRISMGYLKAIEAEDSLALPAKAYLKGYVGQYAAEIGLEPHRVVQGYPPLSGE
jgi:curved DNA-binding protein CbpA